MLDEPRGATHLEWTFLSNHAHVLICIAKQPEIRVREVAARVGITERSVQTIIADLEAAGYISRSRQGRRNHYEVHMERPFRHPVAVHREIGSLLRLIVERDLPENSDHAKEENED